MWLNSEGLAQAGFERSPAGPAHPNSAPIVKHQNVFPPRGLPGLSDPVEVHDRGVGIPEDELAAVQRKFVRGRLALSGGAGIGLSIVSRILKQHSGTFELESRLGVGTIARIGVPVG